jgi:dTDP-4-amino-4,6-dideoxygalactose transaminase
MITTADAELASRLRRLRQHAMTVSDVARHSSSNVIIESYDEVGFNYRMTDLQAAVGLAQLERLDEMLARRRALAQRYSSAFSSLPWLRGPQEADSCRHNFQSYMVRLNDRASVGRDELMQELLDRSISSRRGVMAIHREAPYRCGGAWQTRLPVTERVADSTIILPLFHEMADTEQNYVVNCIRHLGPPVHQSDGRSSALLPRSRNM